MRTLKIKATEPQAAFHSLACKHPAFVGGFGTGKSETMANQAILDASHSSDALIGLYEPTYDLVRLIMAPRMEKKLSEYGISYKYNKAENIIYTSNGGFGDFILRTLDNPARLIGYETYRGHIDEIDTLKDEHATDVWNMLVARNRQKPEGVEKPFNRLSIYTTPEGFKFTYRTWKESPKKGYELVQASTLSNPFLPDDYVETLKQAYPSQLIDAYINGDFVNLTSGRVYAQFDRKLNASTEVVEKADHLHIGMDFNVAKMSAVVHVLRQGIPHAVDEITGAFDTPAMIEIIKNRYPMHSISIYPDASGQNRKSVSASETDISLLKRAGFRVYHETKNPRVRDRVVTVNSNFCNAKGERRYFVNVDKCPTYTKDLEQQVYDKNGEPDKKHDTDHTTDAAGYFIYSMFPVIKPTTQAKAKWRM